MAVTLEPPQQKDIQRSWFISDTPKKELTSKQHTPAPKNLPSSLIEAAGNISFGIYSKDNEMFRHSLSFTTVDGSESPTSHLGWS